MANYINRIQIIGLHNKFDIDQEFQPGMNIIYAVNGAGKTTLLHCIANILNGDYYQFLYIQFFRIKIWFDNNENLLTIYNNSDQEQEPSIKVYVNSDRRGKKINKKINEFDELRGGNYKSEEDAVNSPEEDQEKFYKQDYTRTKVLLSTAYFPAFRTMIEAWQSVDKNITIDRTISLARIFFGDFLPLLKYPTPKDVEQSLIDEIKLITSEISRIDRQLMSKISIEYISASLEEKSNLDIDYSLDLIIEEIETIFRDIKSFPLQDKTYISSTEIYTYISSTEIYRHISDKKDINILNEEKIKEFIKFSTIYLKALKEFLKEIKNKFYLFYKYLSAVNSFLIDKKIEVLHLDTEEDSQLVRIRFHDNSVIDGLKTLSSGERQIVTILYAVTYMSQEKLILIDELEISLHIDWQRKLLKKISEQQSQVQIIVCTHSPMIAADYPDNRKGLQLKYTDINLWGVDDLVDENEISKSTDNTEESFDDYDFIPEE